MKKILFMILAVVIIAIILYAIWAFAWWDMAMKNWDGISRSVLAILFVAFSLTACAGIYSEMK